MHSHTVTWVEWPKACSGLHLQPHYRGLSTGAAKGTELWSLPCLILVAQSIVCQFVETHPFNTGLHLSSTAIHALWSPVGMVPLAHPWQEWRQMAHGVSLMLPIRGDLSALVGCLLLPSHCSGQGRHLGCCPPGDSSWHRVGDVDPQITPIWKAFIA